MSLTSFDKYSVYARLIPALIVLLPVGLSIVCIFPQKFIGWDLLVWLGTSCGMAIFLEQLARDKGKVKEPKLYEIWGGKPTTIKLRHRDSDLDSSTLNRYHRKLMQLIGDIQIPTAEEEREEPERADEIYETCISFLKVNTRDKEKFRMVFTENVNYGFRRNLWGMKPYAIIFILLSTCIVLTQIHPYWAELNRVKSVVFVAIILDISFLIVWIFHIKPSWIKIVADAYAQQLLAACDLLDNSNN
jgi:hypothetical protein